MDQKVKPPTVVHCGRQGHLVMLNYQRVNHHDPSVAAKAGEAYAAPGVSPGLASG